MGQVYQATDTQLHRQVALKILPEAFATDPDRLARFQREAQVLASLNHPGIAAIYGIEEAEGTRALVLELVEGADAGGSDRPRPHPVGRSAPDSEADCRGRGSRARSRGDPPRPQAREHQGAGGHSSPGDRNYDLAPEGRFLMITQGGAPTASPEIVVVQNWLEELTRLVPLP